MHPNDMMNEHAESQELETEEPYEDQEDEEQEHGEIYWAAKTAKEVISELSRHENMFFENIERRGFGPIWRSTYAQWHGLDPQNWYSWDTQGISFDGEDGELLRFRINEFRSFVRQLIGMACGTRPSFQASAINTDYASLSQIEADDILVNAIYDQKLGETKRRKSVTEGVLYGLSFAWLSWDPTVGDMIEVPLPLPPEMGGGPSPATKKVRRGGLSLRALPPWDLIRDPNIESSEDHLWSTAIERRSKWELAAAYPRFAAKIKQLQTADHDMAEPLTCMGVLNSSATDRVKVRHWLHKKSPALEEGRYIIYAGDIALYDGPIPYDELPFVDFCPSSYMGTAFGYADVWDLLPINQIIDQLVSDVSTNLSTFGRQLITIGENTDVDVDALANGLRVLTLGQGDEPPQALQLTAIPEAAKWFLGYLEGRLQSLSGLNSVSRGDASTSVKSGQHAALLHSIAIEAQSALQLAVDSMDERIANLALRIVGDFAEYPLAVDIAGVDERSYLTEISKDRIAGISRVKVKTSNPMLRTQAGRMELAQMFLQIPGVITDPAQIIEVLVSGQLKPLYQAPRAQLLRIRWENEQLSKGAEVVGQDTGLVNPDGTPMMEDITPQCPVLSVDNPKTHIEEHLTVLANPQALHDPNVRAGVLTHIAWHLREWRNMDPAVGILLGFPPPPDKGAPVEEDQASGAPEAIDIPKVLRPGASLPVKDMGVKLPKPSESPIPSQTTGQ